MGLIPTLNAPVAGNPRVPTPLVANDNAIRTVVNGNIDDANLASPMGGVYRTLLTTVGLVGEDLAAGTYPVGCTPTSVPGGNAGLSTLVASGTAIDVTDNSAAEGRQALLVPMIYFDDADYAVTGKTQKLRLRAQVNTNATAWSSVTATFGLYSVAFAGGSDLLSLTLAGSPVTGSTVALANPSASTPNSGTSSSFTIPSDGQYCIGVVTSATLTNNAAALLTAQLQTNYV